MNRILLTVIVLLTGAVAAGGPVPSTSVASSVLLCGGSMMNGDQFADTVLPVMRAHFAGCRKVALVLHASHPSDRDRMEARLQKAFAHLGVPSAESLHHYDVAGAKTLMEGADGIFVGGGETYLLLGELHRTGQLEQIRRLVLAGVPYGGSSAGANVAGLHIGTTNDFPVADIPSRMALGIFPAVINPHHPAPEAKADHDSRAGKIRSYLRFNPTEMVFALGNASIVRMHGGRVTLETGLGWLYRAGGVRPLVPGELAPELTH